MVLIGLVVSFQAAGQKQKPLSPAAAPPVETKRFTGRMQPDLKPDLVHVYPKIFSASMRPVRFDPVLDNRAVVSAGGLSDPRAASGRSEAFLVEDPTGDPFIAIDENANGTIEQTERHSLQKNTPIGHITVIELPLKGSFFKSYPVLIHYVRGLRNSKLLPTERLVNQSILANAHGDVEINGRKVLFQYSFEPQNPAMSTIDGLFGIDVDGDGKIRDEQFSPESSYATKTELVFRLGDLFVSTEKIDLIKNEITIRTRAASEYLRHDIAIGKELPDFAFVDFAGKRRKLSEFKGKYVLVDFWGVWCGDCLVETPFHIEAYERFRSRGLEILSLNTDENIETARGYLTKNNITWTQATNASIRPLVETTFRLQEFPTTILIGPDLKVIGFNQKQLRGEELLKSLDAVLPK